MTATDGYNGHGFFWGPMVVSRLSEIEWRKDRGAHRVLEVKTEYRSLEVYVSPTGRNMRVFLDGKELT